MPVRLACDPSRVTLDRLSETASSTSTLGSILDFVRVRVPAQPTQVQKYRLLAHVHQPRPPTPTRPRPE